MVTLQKFVLLCELSIFIREEFVSKIRNILRKASRTTVLGRIERKPSATILGPDGGKYTNIPIYWYIYD